VAVDWGAVGIHDLKCTTQGYDIEALLEKGKLHAEPIRQRPIIRIHPCHKRALTRLKASIQCTYDAGVRLPNELDPALLLAIPLQD
jgi:hypothetical protein